MYKLQWLAEKLDFLANYYINRVTLSKDYYYAVFKISVNRYGIGLSNELLFIIIAQVAAKL